MSDELFQRILDDLGIGPPSEIAQKLPSRPYATDDPNYVKVPPFDPPATARSTRPRRTHPIDSVREQFVRFQLSTIASEIDINPLSKAVAPTRPVISIGIDCTSVEEFIKLKQRLAIRYRDLAEDFGWPEPITVCMAPICLNPAVPGFEYCAGHLPLSPRFNDQILLGKCVRLVGSVRCGRPCSSGDRFCRIHFRTQGRRREED
jgi:hypothetical protein